MSVVSRTAPVLPAGAPSSLGLQDASALKQASRPDLKATKGLPPAKQLPVLPVVSGRVETVVVGGHRGNGENLAGSLPFLRENTVASFQRAIQAGAAFLEFDVQVTQDGVPVIWHDNWIQIADSSGAVIQRQSIRETTLEQFKALVSDTPEERGTHLVRNFKTTSGAFMATAQSWQATEEHELPTLAEVFSAIPDNIGFDIEIKSTTPSTWMCTPAAEVKRIVDAVTGSVLGLSAGHSRPIAFSSFDPDICLALRQIQSRIPVLFLSGAGESFHCDPRRISVDAAIAHALEASLQGLVLHSAALRHHRSAAQKALSLGLSVLTYGLDNNDPQWVREQQALGVQAAIVDNVAGVVPVVRAPAVVHAAS